ncbi:ankyrin repeat domain-containing protein [Massilia sp. R2A-15]|uniref:ankyrin repeat domain-containing protein n=1 Tax=Massilia sp. R2A-15 TaxID=3064278 RepID=UPI00273479C1|nr:ankyrin repeat domain-containing protein [Massilia sp. R2A-15]WLI89062.1 ankyrin repeat domain-containing protein [Massilia sp. R2A-15]
MIVRGKPSIGCCLALVTPVLLAADMVWENTALSWASGPQMIGFSLLHTVGIILFPAILASLAWIVVSVSLPLFKTRTWRLSNLLGALAIVVSLGIAFLPYGFWVSTFAGRIAKGPHATEFLVDMAASGQTSAVLALLDQGVDINSQGRSGTALHGAAVRGELDVIRLLIARGADVNAINAYGDSPLASAIHGWRPASGAKELLERNGAKLVRGSEEQRNRVIGEQMENDAKSREAKNGR